MTENNCHSLCGKCLKQPPEFDLVLSPYLYQAPLDKLVTRFKFHAGHSAGQRLAWLLADYLQKNMQQARIAWFRYHFIAHAYADVVLTRLMKLAVYWPGSLISRLNIIFASGNVRLPRKAA
jgi:hypothetical protein